MRCHWCQKELVENVELAKEESFLQAEVQIYECPDDHCTIQIAKETGLFYSYIFFVDIGEARYKVIGHNTESRKATILMKKQRKEAPRSSGYGAKSYVTSYSVMLELKRFLKPGQDKEGVLSAEALFQKLKKLVIFS